MTAPELAPGAILAGRYQVASLLGQGGSSNTYYCRAQDGREVVAKLFDPAMRQRADIMQMVEQVYGMTNAMPADLVARIVDAGYDPTTMAPFSATDRVPLPSLAQLVSQRVLTPEETIGLLKALARAIDAAHGAKLLHHALKPTNVFLGLGPNTALRVTDFGAGLARLAVPTAEGYALAAPWLAPEQVQQGVQAGPSADVFAAALLAFHAMTGRSYWRSCQGATDLAGWQREIVSPRDAASTRAGQIGVQLNRAFDPVIGCALGVDPNQRYRSVGELAAAFESVVGSRGPDGAHTVAFPQQGAGDYPPPPAPMGAAAQAPYPPPEPPRPLGGATLASAGPADGRPPFAPAAPRSASSKVAPIVVILVALVLVGGGATALVLMGKKKPADDGPIAVAAATAGAATAPAEPGASASADTGSTAPAGSASAAASAEPAASGSASADPGGAPVEVAITCEPGCDEVKVDDKVIDLKDKEHPLTLPPGRHKISLTRQGYYPLSEGLLVPPGSAKLEKTYHLAAAPKAAGSAGKPCGKFLKHCD